LLPHHVFAYVLELISFISGTKVRTSKTQCQSENACMNELWQLGLKLKFATLEKIQSFVSHCVNSNVFINLCELVSIDHWFWFVQTNYRKSDWTQFKKSFPKYKLKIVYAQTVQFFKYAKVLQPFEWSSKWVGLERSNGRMVERKTKVNRML